MKSPVKRRCSFPFDLRKQEETVLASSLGCAWHFHRTTCRTGKTCPFSLSEGGCFLSGGNGLIFQGKGELGRGKLTHLIVLCRYLPCWSPTQTFRFLNLGAPAPVTPTFCVWHSGYKPRKCFLKPLPPVWV